MPSRCVVRNDFLKWKSARMSARFEAIRVAQTVKARILLWESFCGPDALPSLRGDLFQPLEIVYAGRIGIVRNSLVSKFEKFSISLQVGTNGWKTELLREGTGAFWYSQSGSVQISEVKNRLRAPDFFNDFGEETDTCRSRRSLIFWRMSSGESRFGSRAPPATRSFVIERSDAAKSFNSAGRSSANSRNNRTKRRR